MNRLTMLALMLVSCAGPGGPIYAQEGPPEADAAAVAQRLGGEAGAQLGTLADPLADLSIRVLQLDTAAPTVPARTGFEPGHAPMTVELSPGQACPVPIQRVEVLPLPGACPAPWDGRLYTPEADQAVRDDVATLDAYCGKLDSELTRCRAVRTSKVLDLAPKLDGIDTKLEVVTTLLKTNTAAQPHCPSTPWGWAALSVGLGAASGALVAHETDTGRLGTVGYTASGAALGAGIVAAVDWITG